MKAAAFRLLLITLYFGYGQAGGDNVATWVQRRYFEDFYHLREGKSHTVCTENSTFMVEERQCIKNEEIINKCQFALDTSNHKNTLLVHLLLSEDLILIDTSQTKSINASLHQIVSLEVYRGLNNSIEINPSGFTLTDHGIFEIDERHLAYNISEYEGELFRMNLSSSESLAITMERECFFFKAWEMTSLKEPKFNCTVPGILYDHSSTDTPTFRAREPSLTTPTAPMIVATSSNSTTATTTSNLTIPNEKQSPKFHIEVGSHLFYTVVGGGGGMIVLLICCGLFCVCAVLICRRNWIKALSAITSTETERRISTASRQGEAKNTDKDTDLELHMYEVPGQVLRLNTYGCNCLEENPAYLKPGNCSGMTSGISEEMLECSYAIIPAHKTPEYDCDDNGKEPLYQEILSNKESKPSPSQSKDLPHSNVNCYS